MMTKVMVAWLPSADDVSPAALNHANVLKDRFLARHPNLDPRTAEFRDEYQYLFRKQNLPNLSPRGVTRFANSNIGGAAGNMSVFNIEWSRLGEVEATLRVREAIDHLLYGPVQIELYDRLTDLITGAHGLGMKGFREALLTKVLCVAQPERFLPIYKFTAKEGKREYAERVYGLVLPAQQLLSLPIGRLIFWSNDLLRDLVGDGFEDGWRMAQFSMTPMSSHHRRGVSRSGQPVGESSVRRIVRCCLVHPG